MTGAQVSFVTKKKNSYTVLRCLAQQTVRQKGTTHHFYDQFFGSSSLLCLRLCSDLYTVHGTRAGQNLQYLSLSLILCPLLPWKVWDCYHACIRPQWWRTEQGDEICVCVHVLLKLGVRLVALTVLAQSPGRVCSGSSYLNNSLSEPTGPVCVCACMCVYRYTVYKVL